MEFVDPVFHQLVGGHFLRILPFFYKAAFQAVFYICELYAGVAYGRPSVAMQEMGFLAHFRGHFYAVALKEPLVSVYIAYYFYARIDFSIAFYKTANSA